MLARSDGFIGDSDRFLAVNPLQAPNDEMAPGHILKMIDEEGVDEGTTGCADGGNGLCGGLFRHLDAEAFSNLDD